MKNPSFVPYLKPPRRSSFFFGSLLESSIGNHRLRTVLSESYLRRLSGMRMSGRDVAITKQVLKDLGTKRAYPCPDKTARDGSLYGSRRFNIWKVASARWRETAPIATP